MVILENVKNLVCSWLHCTTARGSSKDHIDIEYKEGKQSLILRLALFVEDIDVDVREGDIWAFPC